MALISIINKFSFFHQVRNLISKLCSKNKKLEQILDEDFNFTSTLSLRSPNGEVENIYKNNKTESYCFSIYQNGLTGATGALPTAYTEWLIERDSRYNDLGPKAFLDIFNHRQYCLAYLAWQKQHYSVSLDDVENSTISNVVLSACGMLNTPNRMPGNGYSQFYAYSVRSLINLERILRQYYQMPVEINPFSGCWKDVEMTERCQLGNGKNALAYGPVIGSVRWDITSNFEVIIGPVDLTTARNFMSGGKYYRCIQEQIRAYVGLMLDFKMKIKVNSAAQDPIAIGKGQLGLNISIGTQTNPSVYMLNVQ
ncbi:type VI secretion system baseplate subunit TssG [Raoultella planticola]|uniref:type VI secretion system baseplate subunit TssG n=1 Tax=Raoultella planticola TaxID=575 RepID=UPI001F22019E|nr:type VI secretion system baseplate subunit TssG [Raoultella planticola]MCE9860014.1 type VI secretion system baseplate subunit TssG [Raoultella planticola]